MKNFCIFVLAAFQIVIVSCGPFDDGKYSPTKYSIFDDGKYYRPLDEGKYIPGDEGRYTYVYRNTLYPAFPYEHVVGPSGGNGGEGGFGGNGADGSNGNHVQDESNRIEYIGRKIYADRFPYVHKVIKALVDQYVSSDNLFGEASEGSANHYKKVYADKESAVKCQYLKPKDDEKEFVTQYPPSISVPAGEKLGSYYSFKGTKVLSTINNALKNKIKIEYEVFVRVVDEVTD